MASRLLPPVIALVALVALVACGGDSPRDELHEPAGVDATHSDRPRVAGASAVGSGWLPDGPRSRAIVWAVGDARVGAAGRAVVRLIARRRADRVLYLGDVYDRGTPAEFGRFGRMWAPLARRTAPTPGNHEWANRAEGYNAYWRRIHGTTPPQWYSFRAGGWQILVLNSETSRRRAQLEWLRARLRARGDCRLAVIHRPRYSASLHGDDTTVDRYWRSLQDDARIVVSGHDHGMQRFRARGTLTQVVSGAGGAAHYRIDRSRAGLVFADDTRDGALRLELRPGSARLSFISTAGRTLDSAKVPCRR